MSFYRSTRPPNQSSAEKQKLKKMQDQCGRSPENLNFFRNAESNYLAQILTAVSPVVTNTFIVLK